MEHLHNAQRWEAKKRKLVTSPVYRSWHATRNVRMKEPRIYFDHKNRRFIPGAAGWYISLDVLDRSLSGNSIGRMVDADAMKFAGWLRLVPECAKQFDIETANWPPQAAQRS